MTRLDKSDHFVLVHRLKFQTFLVKRNKILSWSINLTNSASSVSMEHGTYSYADDRLFFYAVQ